MVGEGGALDRVGDRDYGVGQQGGSERGVAVAPIAAGEAGAYRAAAHRAAGAGRAGRARRWRVQRGRRGPQPEPQAVPARALTSHEPMLRTGTDKTRAE